MGELVYILGESGTGKSFGIRTLDPKTTVIISITPKTFTFEHNFTYLDSANKKGNYAVMKDVNQIIASLKFIEQNMPHITTYVIDDFTYLQSFEYFKRIHSKGYDRFNEVGDVFFKLIDYLLYEIDRTKIVFLLGHTMTESVDGTKMTKMKTIGTLVERLLNAHGLSNNVLGTFVERIDKENVNYYYVTQNNNNDIFKSSQICKFDYLIPNDLEFVRQAIDKTIIK